MAKYGKISGWNTQLTFTMAKLLSLKRLIENHAAQYSRFQPSFVALQHHFSINNVAQLFREQLIVAS